MLCDFFYCGYRFTVEHDDLGFRVCRDGRTADHPVNADRTSTMLQAITWLQYAMAAIGAT
jgi:elongation factor P hydroxylase